MAREIGDAIPGAGGGGPGRGDPAFEPGEAAGIDGPRSAVERASAALLRLRVERLAPLEGTVGFRHGNAAHAGDHDQDQEEGV